MEGDVITLQDIFKFRSGRGHRGRRRRRSAGGDRPASVLPGQVRAERRVAAQGHLHVERPPRHAVPRRCAQMRGKLIGVGLALLSASALVPAATAAAGEPIAQSARAMPQFPDRSYVLTLPEQTRLDSGDVTVTENGGPVRGLRVAPVGATRRSRLGVVLAVDTSASMHGAPQEAPSPRPGRSRGHATAGSHSRSSPSGVDLGWTCRSPPTRSRSGARWRDPFPPAAARTSTMRDFAASSCSASRSLPGGFLVLLTDGTDHGSRTSAQELAAAAREARVRIYAVGLRSSRFDPVAPRRLAESTGGAYSEASSPQDLERIFSALGAELSNGYLVRYRSLADPDRRVSVRVSVGESRHRLRRHTASPRLHTGALSPDGEQGVWSSTLATVLAALVVAGLLGLSLLTAPVAQAADPARAGGPVRDPVAGGRPVPLIDRPARGRRRAVAVSGRVVGRLHDGARRRGNPPVARAGGPRRRGWWLRGAVLLAVATGQPLVGVIAFALVPVAVRLIVNIRADRQRRKFEEQLADHLAVVGGAMRAGHGLPAALASVLDDAPEPSRREFARVVADERLGAPLEEAIEALARRMRNRDVEQLALLARLHRETGADAAEMLDRVVETVRERHELRGMVRTLTAQGRLSRWILSALPPVDPGRAHRNQPRLRRSALQHHDRQRPAGGRGRHGRQRLARDQANRQLQDLGARCCQSSSLPSFSPARRWRWRARAVLLPRIQDRRKPRPHRSLWLRGRGGRGIRARADHPAVHPGGQARCPSTSRLERRARTQEIRGLLLAAGVWNTKPATIVGYRILSAVAAGGTVAWLSSAAIPRPSPSWRAFTSRAWAGCFPSSCSSLAREGGWSASSSSCPS